MRFLSLVLLALTCSCVTTQASLPAGVERAKSLVAIENVTVLPMDSERVLAAQSILVADDRIAWIGPAASLQLPKTARRVDGTGKFVIPGLAEMHGHLPPAQAPAWAMPQYLTLFVANGVTVVRGMLGAPNQLEVRRQIGAGALLGPTLVLGAPSLNGNSAPDAATAERLIREHKAAGYDFLKLHPGLKPEVYDRIVQVAREVGLTWAGHVSSEVGVEKALATRQSTIDHLDGYLEVSGDAELRRRVASPTETVSYQEIVAGIRPERVTELALATRSAGTWTVPTLALFEQFFSLEGPRSEAQFPEQKYMAPGTRQAWAQQAEQRVKGHQAEKVSADELEAVVRFRRELLKAISDAGGGILIGSDAPQTYSVPGFSIPREAKAMVAAGLTPFQVLQSATRNVATYVERDLGGDGGFGTVEVGKRADLVLLDRNPLEDIGALGAIRGVVLRGQWLPREELDAMLEQVEQSHASP